MSCSGLAETPAAAGMHEACQQGDLDPATTSQHAGEQLIPKACPAGTHGTHDSSNKNYKPPATPSLIS